MSFTVEDGTGLSTANSYTSVADADSYFADHGVPTDWAAASSGAKQVALVKATQYLDAKYKLRWKGCKKLSTQKLDWPRYGAYDSNEYWIDSESVPSQVKDAACQLANSALTAELFTTETSPGAISYERSKVGPVEQEIHYTGGKTQQVKYTLAVELLKEVIESSDEVERG